MPQRPNLLEQLPEPVAIVSTVNTLITRRNHPAGIGEKLAIPGLALLNDTAPEVALYGPTLLGGALIVAAATERKVHPLTIAVNDGNKLETLGGRLINAHRRFGLLDPASEEFPALKEEGLDHHLSILEIAAVDGLHTGLCDRGLRAQRIVESGLLACQWYFAVQLEINAA